MRRWTVAALLVVLAAAWAGPAHAGDDGTPPPVRDVLRAAAKLVASGPADRCEAAIESIAALPFDDLGEDDWIDARLLLLALHRRLTPEPKGPPAPEPTPHDTDFDRDCRARGRIPVGERRFAWLLRHRHGLALSPRDVMRIGRDARRQVRHELEAFAAEHGDGRTWREMAAIQADDHPATHDELVALCRRLADESMDTVERSGLVTVPPAARGLRVSVATRSFPYSFAWYRPGSRDKSGVFGARYEIAPLPDGLDAQATDAWLRDFDEHWIRVISAHEGVPGHHLQFSCASGVRSRFRRMGYNSVYVEGWGFYTEGLMARTGHLDAPLDHLAMLRMRAWRAVRCYVDPALHLGRIRPSEAVRMLMDEVGLSERAATREVQKFMDNPTQPLGYWIGRRRIEAMRRRYLDLHGDAPGVEREFHDRFLALGCIPLPLAEEALFRSPRGGGESE